MDRPYAGAADLQRMEASVARAYSSTSLRVGDISWLSRDHSHRELSLDIRLWEDANGELIAWAYYRPNGEFNVFVAPHSGHVEDACLFDSLLAFVDASAQASVAAGDPPVTLNTYAIDPTRSTLDRSLAAALERAGYEVDEATETSGFLVRSLDDLPPATLPDGYHFASVSTPALLIGRVEAHRAAFAPSDLSVKRYERLQRTVAYRSTLDRLAVTDAGEVVAFCTAWFDADNASGLLEPVGTHPTHQRRGLARAVCLDACHALRAIGARKAQVGYGSAAGFATYTSAGFRKTNDELTFSKAWRSG